MEPLRRMHMAMFAAGLLFLQPVARSQEAKIAPWRPDVAALNRLLDDGTREGRLKPVYPQAIALLSSAVRDRPHAHFRGDPDPAGQFSRISPKVLVDLDELKAQRARPVEILGRLVEVRPVSAKAVGLPSADYPRPLVSGTLESDGCRVRLLVVQDSDSGTGSRRLTPGGRAKALGVFYRLREDPDGTVYPFVLATRLLPAVALPLREELPRESAARLRAVERDHATSVPHREDVFYDVLGFVLAKGAGLVADPLLLEGRRPLNEPDKYRLKAVRAKGLLVYLARESFEFPEMHADDAPVLGYWHAIIADEDSDANVPVSVVLPFDELPDEFAKLASSKREPRRGRTRPVVEVRGIYYRLRSYEVRGRAAEGPAQATLPMMIAAVPPTVVSK